jgi:hypothetical protein
MLYSFFIFNNKFSLNFSFSQGKGIMFLRNVGTYLLVNTVRNPGILLSSDRRANELSIFVRCKVFCSENGGRKLLRNYGKVLREHKLSAVVQFAAVL